MVAKATVRVRASDELPGHKPEQQRLERAAELLKESGFEVLRVGRFGVNIQGDEQAFVRELGVNVADAQPLVGAVSPHHEELSSLIDLVEVTGRPISFDQD